MPTYEYKCKACGHAFEQFQSMTAPPVKVCPECKKKKVERLIGTGAALIFKGSGFYITDYRSDSYKKAKDADKPSESKPAESKPAETKAADTTPAKPAAAKVVAEPKPAAAKSSSSKSKRKSAS